MNKRVKMIRDILPVKIVLKQEIIFIINNYFKNWI